MKKFKVLFAVLAVLAMATTAFADANNNLEIGDYAGSDAINNGAIVTKAANAFYYGDAPQTLTVGFKVTVGASGEGVATEDTVVGYKLNDGALVRTETQITKTSTNQFIGDLALPLALSEGKIALTVVGSYATGDETAKGDTDELTVTAKAVTLTAKDNNGAGTDRNGETINIKTGSTTPIEIKVAGAVEDTADTVVVTSFVAKSGDVAVTTTGDQVVRTGIKVKYDAGVLTVTPDATAVAGDSFTIGIYSANNDDAAKILTTASSTSVAGIAKNAKLMEVSFTVVDYEVKPTSITYDLDKSSDIALSFDVDMAVAQLDAISCDGIVLLSTATAAGAKVGTTSDYLSNDIAVSADQPVKDSIVITLGKDHLNAKIAALVPEADGSIRKTVTYKVVDKSAKSADLVVNFVKAAPVLPPAPPYVPEVEIKSTDVAIESASGVTGSVVAVNVEPRKDVLAAIAGTTSADNAIDRLVRNASVVSLDIVATMTVDVNHTDDNAAANFAITTGAKTPKNGFAFFAMIQRKAGKTDEGKYDLFPTRYENGQLKFTIRPVGDYFSANDIYIVEAQTRGSSSSGCSMGFGLAAVAGLAALALRKRSK